MYVLFKIRVKISVKSVVLCHLLFVKRFIFCNKNYLVLRRWKIAGSAMWSKNIVSKEDTLSIYLLFANIENTLVARSARKHFLLTMFAIEKNAYFEAKAVRECFIHPQKDQRGFMKAYLELCWGNSLIKNRDRNSFRSIKRLF